MQTDWLLPWLITNGLALGLLLLALRRTPWLPGIYSFVFLAAGLFNAYTALQQPQIYVEGFGPQAAWFYQGFIYGFFSQHTALLVLLIALGQLAVGCLLLLKDPWLRLGLLGGMLFLLAITPLGIGSAFPAPLLMAATLVLAYHRLGQSLESRQIHA